MLQLAYYHSISSSLLLFLSHLGSAGVMSLSPLLAFFSAHDVPQATCAMRLVCLVLLCVCYVWCTPLESSESLREELVAQFPSGSLTSGLPAATTNARLYYCWIRVFVSHSLLRHKDCLLSREKNKILHPRTGNNEFLDPLCDFRLCSFDIQCHHFTRSIRLRQ